MWTNSYHMYLFQIRFKTQAKPEIINVYERLKSVLNKVYAWYPFDSRMDEEQRNQWPNLHQNKTKTQPSSNQGYTRSKPTPLSPFVTKFEWRRWEKMLQPPSDYSRVFSVWDIFKRSHEFQWEKYGMGACILKRKYSIAVFFWIWEWLKRFLTSWIFRWALLVIF